MFSWIRYYAAEVCALPSSLLVLILYSFHTRCWSLGPGPWVQPIAPEVLIDVLGRPMRSPCAVTPYKQSDVTERSYHLNAGQRKFTPSLFNTHYANPVLHLQIQNRGRNADPLLRIKKMQGIPASNRYVMLIKKSH